MLTMGVSRRLACVLLPAALLLVHTGCEPKGGGGAEAHGAHGAEAAPTPPKGPHNGRLLTEGDFGVEVTIFERGVPPEFRVYAYESKKPVDVAGVKLSIDVHRLGGRVDTIAFHKEDDFLRGDKVVYEPHSFDVKVTAEFKGKTYRLGYAQAEARTELTPDAQKSAGLEIEEAGQKKLKKTLELPGEVALDPDKVAHVVPRFDGVVIEVRKNLGDRTTKGEIVAVLESTELAAARMRYILAVHKEEFAQSMFEREEKLWQKKISPEEDYLSKRYALEGAKLEVRGADQTLRALGLLAEEIKQLLDESADGDATKKEKKHEENLSRYELRAPQDGIVIEKNIALGEAIKGDADIFAIADLSTVLIGVTIHGSDLKSVRANQDVHVKCEALALEAEGKVAYVGPVMAKESRTAKAHVRIPNPEGLWRAGLFVTVQLVQEEFTVPVAVKADALQSLRDWEVVFIQDGNQFEAVPLEIGRRSGEWVEVLGGLGAGMKYVSKNSFIIKADILKSGATHDH